MNKNNGSGRKTGIMGGTFNPIHTGHLMLAQRALEEACLDRVLFIPAGCPYMKEQSRLTDAEKRLEMVAAAIADNPAFSVSDIEIKRGGFTYTCDTLEQLKEMRPEEDLYFIMGADCLFAVESWYKPEKIFRSCHILAAARGDVRKNELERQCERLKEKYGADILLLRFPTIDISSTEIRMRAARGMSLRYLVPESVRKYIEDNALYGFENKIEWQR